VPVSCCIDPRGQVVVNREAAIEVGHNAQQYQMLCPEPCDCDTTHPGTPGCVRGNQLCGYN
jgi:hypothetical protein